jgi:hypothetical protein
MFSSPVRKKQILHVATAVYDMFAENELDG